MSHGFVLKGILIAAVVLAFTCGCSRPVTKPTPSTAGSGAGNIERHDYKLGQPVTEDDLQVVQADLRVIYFGYDSYSLSDEAEEDLQYNTAILKKTPEVKVVAEGHCDERGTAEYNLALGERRAQAVADYLVTLGVDEKRLSTVSYGSELPVDPDHNEEAWRKNRRVYLRVYR
jgi:peptidoglycan-associated lipoprotein